MAKAELSGVLRAVSGKLGGVVFRRTKHGTVLARRPGKGPPPSEAQQAMRAAFGAAAKRWGGVLTEAERAGWERAAERLGYTSGHRLFGAASMLLEASGRRWRSPAPAGEKPPPVTALEAEWRDAGNTLVLRVTWGGEVRAGTMLFVESTGPSCSPARKPLERELRGVCGLRAESFAVVGEGMSEFVFRGVLRPVQEGSRVGLRVRLVSAEGIVSDGWWGEVRAEVRDAAEDDPAGSSGGAGAHRFGRAESPEADADVDGGAFGPEFGGVLFEPEDDGFAVGMDSDELPGGSIAGALSAAAEVVRSGEGLDRFGGRELSERGCVVCSPGHSRKWRNGWRMHSGVVGRRSALGGVFARPPDYLQAE